MTEFKVSAKIHLFIIISSVIIAVGLAVGTICHFCAGGFFNYGNEFAGYKTVVVTYYSSEYIDDSAIKPVCDEQLKEFSPYGVSSADNNNGGEIVYKFSVKTDTQSLQAAVDALNVKLDAKGTGVNVASVHEVTADEGGSRAITYASIALASAAAFQFIYFILRYKLRAAYSAILACVHNLGVFVALAAITRLPVGASMIALGAAVVFMTMVATCVYFDRVRKNFNSDAYSKSARIEVVEASAMETRKAFFTAAIVLAAAAVIYGVFASIAALYIGAFAPGILAVYAVIACLYGSVFFTPAVHSGIDALCEKVKLSVFSSSKDKKEKKTKSVKKEKKETKETATDAVS